MNTRKLTAGVLPVLAAVAVGAGTVHAEPVTGDVGYETVLSGDTVRTTLSDGYFAVSGDERTVDIRSADGATLVTLPLAVRQDGLEYPLPHRIGEAGRVLELTAVRDVAAVRPVEVTPVASLEENQLAMQAFASQFGIATAIGGFIGTAIGVAIGLTAFVGGVIGIPAVVTGAALGGIIGTLVAGGPTLIIAGMDLIATLAAPPGTTKWMELTGR
ncbi:hypothetical protein BJY24_001909 [Nocardia transvalensis]|uniref:DUF8020 domain-containing protein n=1 Tax=Nocardia transvalensis TaxID=37333 RepID=A0A7W9PBG9_9NOCA|nr:hypothetical protein [Nocardia transvalensis]MBB5913042.1 hypothetical protein [Nocardia transvalensis]